LAATLVGPIAAIFLLFVVTIGIGTSWHPLPWVIGIGGIALMIIGPLLLTRENRLIPPTQRRTAAFKIAFAGALITGMAELFIFGTPNVIETSLSLLVLFGIVAKFFERRNTTG